MELYKPGLHIIAKLTDCNNAKISELPLAKTFILACIDKYNLKNLGDVYHQFDNGGYTLVVCLSESHLSIHTWPEFDIVNFDIYLSNHERSNEGLVETICNDLVKFFEGTVLEKQAIKR
jgi:S-adenosylmethionine decarboxylase